MPGFRSFSLAMMRAYLLACGQEVADQVLPQRLGDVLDVRLHRYVTSWPHWTAQLRQGRSFRLTYLISTLMTTS
jgi:hypothetical protein